VWNEIFPLSKQRATGELIPNLDISKQKVPINLNDFTKIGQTDKTMVLEHIVQESDRHLDRMRVS